MAARVAPSGSVPDKSDVKAPEDSSKPADTQVQASAKTQEAQAKEPELDEKDLEEIEGKKVPYNRFREVNEKAKSYEQKVKTLEQKHSEDLRRAVEDAELRVSQRFAKEKEDSSVMEEIDPVQREVRTLKQELTAVRGELSSIKGESASDRLKSNIERFENKYPQADTLAVLAIAKHLGRVATDDIEELMHENHTRNLDRAKKQVQEIIEGKKQRAKAAMPTREGGIKLKESDRPKTLKEASAKLKSFFGS